MKYLPIEKIWERFNNKYEAIILGAREVHRVIEALHDNKLEITEDPYIYALKRILTADQAQKKTAKKKTTDAAQG